MLSDFALIVGPIHWRYDDGMTKSKIAISLLKDHLVGVRREVRTDSVSGYIGPELAEQERGDSLRVLLQDLIEEHGKATAKDIQWAKRALVLRQG